MREPLSKLNSGVLPTAISVRVGTVAVRGGAIVYSEEETERGVHISTGRAACSLGMAGLKVLVVEGCSFCSLLYLVEGTLHGRKLLVGFLLLIFSICGSLLEFYLFFFPGLFFDL